jgi:hypothetical protein
MSNPGKNFFAMLSITGNPTVDAALRYALFGLGTFISGAIIGWLNSKGFSGPDLYAYVPMGVLAGLFSLAIMLWGLVKTSKIEALVKLREAIAVKAGIAAERHEDPTPAVKTVTDAQQVIADYAPPASSIEKK